MGRRKEREHGGRWFACCPDEMFLSFGDFRAFRCGHLKAGSGLGQRCKALGCSCWVLADIFLYPPMKGTFGCVAHAVWPPQGVALVLAEEPSLCIVLAPGKALTCFLPVPTQEWQALSDSLCPCSAERVFTGHLGLEVRSQSHNSWP